MWCVTAPGLVYHQICDDKSARTFNALLDDYAGWVVADALGSHAAGARECHGVKLAACWAHVLRRFRDAVADFPEAQGMLAWIGDLYRIDAQAATLEERARLRATESRAVTERMKGWMLSVRMLKTTSLGGDVRYTLGIWSRLTLFLEHPLIWLDNNPTERGLRGPVIGRRNHFGSKSARRNPRRRRALHARRVREGVGRRSDIVPERRRDPREARARRGAAAGRLRRCTRHRELSPAGYAAPGPRVRTGDGERYDTSPRRCATTSPLSSIGFAPESWSRPPLSGP